MADADVTEVHGMRCARIMGHTAPTAFQRTLLKHAAAASDTACAQIMQSRPRTGKTIATAMGALLGVKVDVRHTQSVLLCSTIEQRDHTAWTVCRMLGKNASRIRVLTATTDDTTHGRWDAVNIATAHVLIGCTGTIYQTVMNYPDTLKHVRFLAVHDADIMFGVAQTDQIMQISALVSTLCGNARMCFVSTVYDEGVLSCIRATVDGQSTDVRDNETQTPEAGLRGREVEHMSVMVEREWKGDMVMHVIRWTIRTCQHARVLVSCANGLQVDRICDVISAVDRVDVVGLHGKSDRRRWMHRRVAQGGLGGRGLVVVSTENIAHDARGRDFDVVVCSDAPFEIGGMIRLVSRAREKGKIVHLLTRDDVITFQRTMRAHGVHVTAFTD